MPDAKMPSEMAFQHYDRGALRGGDRRAPPHSTQRALAPGRPPLVPPPPPSPPPVHNWAARPMGPRAVCYVLSGAHDSLIGPNPFVADDGVTREPRRTSFVRGGEAFRASDARALACVCGCARVARVVRAQASQRRGTRRQPKDPRHAAVSSRAGRPVSQPSDARATIALAGAVVRSLASDRFDGPPPLRADSLKATFLSRMAADCALRSSDRCGFPPIIPVRQQSDDRLVYPPI